MGINPLGRAGGSIPPSVVGLGSHLRNTNLSPDHKNSAIRASARVGSVRTSMFSKPHCAGRNGDLRANAELLQT